MKRVITSLDHETTHQTGNALGRGISGKCNIALTGTLGAGKTTFAQGIAEGLDVPKNYYVTSPTYTIINEYPGRHPFFHIDLYRLESPDELDYLGLDEINEQSGVVVVEWPASLFDRPDILNFDISIDISTDAHFNRVISLDATGLRGANLLKSFPVN